MIPRTTTELPVDWIRTQFPALERDTIYLDNAAGAQVPRTVVERLVDAMTTMQVNKGGAYRESLRVTDVKEQVRAKAATFLNAPAPGNVAFGPNATTLIELLAQAWARRLQPGDEIILTGLDHHANVDPWRRLESLGVVVKRWEPSGPELRLETDDLPPLLSDKTRLVAMTAASNALGTLTPVREAAGLVHDAGAKLMVDAVHYAPHNLPDVQALGADMLVFSPYKVFGPHLGVLYLSDAVRRELTGPGLAFFPELEPINWEPGTQNHEAIAGFGGTFDYLDLVTEKLGTEGTARERWAAAYNVFGRYERALAEKLLAGLKALGVTIYGLQSVGGRTSTVSLNVGAHPAQHVAEHLAERCIAVANGHYYAHDLLMKRLELEPRGGAVRVSVSHYNTEEEVRRLLDALAEL